MRYSIKAFSITSSLCFDIGTAVFFTFALAPFCNHNSTPLEQSLTPRGFHELGSTSLCE